MLHSPCGEMVSAIALESNKPPYWVIALHSPCGEMVSAMIYYVYFHFFRFHHVAFPLRGDGVCNCKGVLQYWGQRKLHSPCGEMVSAIETEEETPSSAPQVRCIPLAGRWCLQFLLGRRKTKTDKKSCIPLAGRWCLQYILFCSLSSRKW